MAKSKIHPQFFQTLAPDFHSHLTIPEDFFIKYIEDTTGEKKTVELKSNASEKTWKVKMIGRSLFDGWEDFAIASNFEVGDVVLVRYEGDFVFKVMGLGPNCSEIPDLIPRRINNDVDEKDDIGKTLLKKRLYPRIQVEFSSEDENEFPRKKKVKKNGTETESFVALVTHSNLRTDTMNLPPSFTSSNGISPTSHQIVLKDERERSWALDLAFNKSSDTFSITRGWKNFCDDNGQKAKGFFVFTLVDNGETPVLSFCPTESTSAKRQTDCSVASRRESLSTGLSSKKKNIEGEDECSSMESLMDTEKKKSSSPIRSLYTLYWPCHKRYITFTLPPDYCKNQWLCLPKPFVRDNGINKPGNMYLSGKEGKRWLINLIQDTKGTMKMGSGWKDFVKANGLCTGESFTLKLTWEDTIPVLSLSPADCSINRGAGRECSETNQKMFIGLSSKKNNIEGEDECSSMESLMDIEKKKYSLIRSSYALYRPCHKLYITFTLPPDFASMRALCLPKPFARDNGINNPGKMYLSGKDGERWLINLIQDTKGTMRMGLGWKDFVTANSLGTDFTLKLTWEDTVPVLSLCPADCSVDRGAGRVSSETNQKMCTPIVSNCQKKISADENANSKEKISSWERGKNNLRGTDLIPSNEKQLVTLRIAPSSFEGSRPSFPRKFACDNGIKPGIIYLCGKDGTKWRITLSEEMDGRMRLLAGWKESLCQDKDGRMGLVASWEEFAVANDLKLGDYFEVELTWEDATPMLSMVCSKANEKEPVSTKPRSRDSSSAIQNRCVTLALTAEDFETFQLYLPREFMKDNGINKLGEMTVLGKNRTKWSAYLMSRNGNVSLGKGWVEFCEANGVKLGESFTLEFIKELNITPVLKFCSQER